MRTPTDRCEAIDIVRLYAMLAMLCSHAAAKLGLSFAVAGSAGATAAAPGTVATAVGLLLHLASPTFALLTGFSLAYYVASRRRKGRPDAEIDSYLLRRGALLLGLGFLIDGVWINPLRLAGMPGILGMFGINLWLLIPLRRLPLAGVFAAAALVAVATQGYLAWRGAPVAPSLPEALLLTGYGHGDGFTFPALPWLPVILFGFACGRIVAGGFSLERLALRAGAALLALWGVVALAMPLPFRKYPPSLDYLLPYLAVACVLLAVHARYRRPAGWWFYRTFIVLGRCPLVFFLLHAKIVANGFVFALAPLRLPGPLALALVVLLSLAVLVPVCSFVLAWTAWRKALVTADPSAAPASPQPSPG